MERWKLFMKRQRPLHLKMQTPPWGSEEQTDSESKTHPGERTRKTERKRHNFHCAYRISTFSVKHRCRSASTHPTGSVEELDFTWKTRWAELGAHLCFYQQVALETYFRCVKQMDQFLHFEINNIVTILSALKHMKSALYECGG